MAVVCILMTAVLLSVQLQNHKQSVGREAAAAKAASAAQRQGFVGDRDAAAQERQRRAAEAAAESERILKEERAKDSDWRAAMMRQIEEVGHDCVLSLTQSLAALLTGAHAVFKLVVSGYACTACTTLMQCPQPFTTLHIQHSLALCAVG